MLVIRRRDLEVTDGTNNVTWLMYRRKDQQRAFWNRTSYIWYFFVWGHQMSLIVWTWVLSFSILFQFCKAAPEDLPICDPLERMPSYISYQYYDRIHGLKMLLQDKMKCVCPNGYNYLDTRYNFVTKGSFDVAIIKYFCLPVSYAIANFRLCTCTWTLLFSKKTKNSNGYLKSFYSYKIAKKMRSVKKLRTFPANIWSTQSANVREITHVLRCPPRILKPLYTIIRWASFPLIIRMFSS